MSKKIQAPTHCPSCGSALEWVSHILYCKNNSCYSRVERRIQHFTKTLKIKGLGPATIKKLDLRGFEDIYELSKEGLTEALSSERLAERLVNEIANSTKAPLNKVLPAFGIPLIGRTAANKLSTTCKSITDINETTCRQAGLGPKATDNLINWLEDEFPKYAHLPFNFYFDKSKPRSTKGIVCITGRLKTYGTKALATDALQEAGYVVKPSLTKDVTILINESGIESAKTKQARESGVTIITNLLELIGEK